MKLVLDASFFFYDLQSDGELYTPPSVIDELNDLRSKSRFDVLCTQGLRVAEPSKESIYKVRQAAQKTGDAGVISDTDCDLLALSLDLDAAVCTDDFAIQNIAYELGVKTMHIQQRKAKKIVWRNRCSGCGRYFEHDGKCPICGSNIKRKLK